MQEWFGISDEEFAKLSRFVTTLDLVRSVPLFHAQDNPVSKVNVMLYLDDNGTDADDKHYFIYKAVVASMPIKDQLEIAQYVEWLEDGEEDGC